MPRVLLSFVLLTLSLTAESQDGFFRNFVAQWEARATKTQAMQPRWSVPMFSPFPIVAQVFRTDFIRQQTTKNEINWNYGGGKGFALIPFANTEIDVFVPGYIIHRDRRRDGLSDMLVLGKYRFLSKTEEKGNYVLSGALSWHIPTGRDKNGAPAASLTPTLLAGKGFGKLALMSSLGGNLPTSQVRTTGRAIHWNSVAQYKVGRYFFPELEVNMTSHIGGKRDGKIQTFLSPGITVGRLPIRSVSKSRLGITVGAGFQFATTSFHPYNHAFSTSVRFVF